MRSTTSTLLNIVILLTLLGIVTAAYLWECAEEKANKLYTEAEESLGAEAYLLTILKKLGKVTVYALIVLFCSCTTEEPSTVTITPTKVKTWPLLKKVTVTDSIKHL